jgi:hypothetical protein
MFFKFPSNTSGSFCFFLSATHHSPFYASAFLRMQRRVLFVQSTNRDNISENTQKLRSALEGSGLFNRKEKRYSSYTKSAGIQPQSLWNR